MKTQSISLFFSLLAAAIIVLPSCRTHGPAFSANADPYMAKPVYRGENEGAFYLSGRINQGYEYYEGEHNAGAELSGHVSYMSQYFYAAGGLFGYWGKYDVNGAVSPVTGGGKQPFNGGGVRGELGGRLPLESNFDVLLGINGEMFGEGGKYAENSSDALADVFTLGLTRIHLNIAPVIDLRLVPSSKWDIGLRYSLDSYISFIDLYESDQNDSYLHRLTLHATVDRVTAYGQIGFTPDDQRVFSLGLAYGIPFKKKEKVAKPIIVE
ncbi:MAG: hypothetical protein H7246_10155 [Phycisphaerae bacterium]|nr:hypothetical protein [Saprospiraceae bacterium]